VLDGERSYGVSPALRSFSALTLDIEPMLSREGQYVQVGVEDDEVVWMGGVAAVVNAVDPPSAFFTGTIETIEDRRVVFTNGTVFTLAERVRPDVRRGGAAVQIDVARHRVIAVRAQASG
jgi:hypothetical protein